MANTESDLFLEGIKQMAELNLNNARLKDEINKAKEFQGLNKPNNENEFDAISHPSHYTEGRKYEPRKVIHDWDLNFNLGNAVKYIARAGRKGPKVEDLLKAIQYIEFELEELRNYDNND